MLTLPVSLFRSESLEFGKPKKVGMPKRSRKAVAVAEDVPVTEDVAGVAAEPPSSPTPAKRGGIYRPLRPTLSLNRKRRWPNDVLFLQHMMQLRRRSTPSRSTSSTYPARRSCPRSRMPITHGSVPVQSWSAFLRRILVRHASPAWAVNSSAAAAGVGASSVMVVCLLHQASLCFGLACAFAWSGV